MLETKALIDEADQSWNSAMGIVLVWLRVEDVEFLQNTCSKHGNNASFPFRRHLQVPRCPDGK